MARLGDTVGFHSILFIRSFLHYIAEAHDPIIDVNETGIECRDAKADVIGTSKIREYFFLLNQSLTNTIALSMAKRNMGAAVGA